MPGLQDVMSEERLEHLGGFCQHIVFSSHQKPLEDRLVHLAPDLTARRSVELVTVHQELSTGPDRSFDSVNGHFGVLSKACVAWRLPL